VQGLRRRRRRRGLGIALAVPVAIGLGRRRRRRTDIALDVVLPVALGLGRARQRMVPVALAAAVPLGYAGLVRPRLARLGATKEEAGRALPGDDLVQGARGRVTMAATIDAPPPDVWPWLAQMGLGRGGWYSVDRLDMFGGSSAEDLHPEWQQIAVGDRLDSSPEGRTWFDVALVEPERVLGLVARVDLRRGVSVPAGEPLPRIAGESSWVFVLEPRGDATRLLVRTAGRQRPWPVGLVNPFGWLPVHALMQWRQLRGLEDRVRAIRSTSTAEVHEAELARSA
jgi:proline iminopeptidase